MFVNPSNLFTLRNYTLEYLYSLTPKFGFNGYGEFIFYRTYSRIKDEKTGQMESWNDVVRRVVEGTFSIRKDWYIKNHIRWDEDYWQNYARGFLEYLFWQKFFPAGRGLWMMGTSFIYRRGSAALANCGATYISNDIGKDIHWLMDMLMLGVGVGFYPIRSEYLKLYNPKGVEDFRIPDSREGWCDCTKAIIDSYIYPNRKKIRPIYDDVRPAGALIKDFGGVSSGPEPLIQLHQQIVEFCERYQEDREYDSVRLKADIVNCVGCAVVAGNVRRSAQLMKGKIKDQVFLDMKDYDKYPEREAWGWMSNNAAELIEQSDFEELGEIARRVTIRGEPGICNRINMRKGRLGHWFQDKIDWNLKEDEGDLFNPCGEQKLENKELCIIPETHPTMCGSVKEWYQACEYATFYGCTVQLLPTHNHETNAIIARNRRIGVSIADFVGWKLQENIHSLVRYMREGYQIVRKTARKFSNEAGVPEPIRCTTVKPGGTGPKLPGIRSGIGYPTFNYVLRRTRIGENSSMHKLLEKNGIRCEPDAYSAKTVVCEWPYYQGLIHTDKKTGEIKVLKAAEQVSLWEQAMNLILVQREWSDNAVSNTLYFKPKWALITIINNHDEALNYLKNNVETLGHILYTDVLTALAVEDKEIKSNSYKIKLRYSDEIQSIIEEMKVYQYDPNHEEDDIEPVLSATVPHCNSLSLLPHSLKGAYKQMPEEGISEEEYQQRKAKMKSIDWSELKFSQGVDEKYCSGDSCEVVKR